MAIMAMEKFVICQVSLYSRTRVYRLGCTVMTCTLVGIDWILLLRILLTEFEPFKFHPQLPVADLDERSFQYSWFEALWAFMRVLMPSRDA